MVVKPDASFSADKVTPRDTPHDEQSSSILDLSMQQRLAAWDDEQGEETDKGQPLGVWLTVDEREALEAEWQRQVEEVKEAWRVQAECKEREREGQHQQKREA